MATHLAIRRPAFQAGQEWRSRRRRRALLESTPSGQRLVIRQRERAITQGRRKLPDSQRIELAVTGLRVTVQARPARRLGKSGVVHVHGAPDA